MTINAALNIPKMLVTSALPYANGHLHLGHLVEHIQVDIWVRAHKLLGAECISVCGDDAHGTPIMLKAEQLGITPEELTATMQASHERDFAGFGIHYDCYHTTNSIENRELVNLIYQRLLDNGDIVKKIIRQAYDPIKSMFLPDRYVKGRCPKCNALDQYGDNCEVCGATYSPTELINPLSVISGTTPIECESEHYFFDLPKYSSLLRAWIDNGSVQPEIMHKLDEWFDTGLKMWDISRDAPYFGFIIPGTVDKYFYVWLDAPVGYMASFKKHCLNTGIKFSEFWDAQSKTAIYHFVGKDIVYFHSLFWPAILAGSGYRLPTAVFAHGFLTVNGQKMSKSRGTFIEARAYLRHLNPEWLRYYFAAKLNGRVEDLDLNFADFINRINADLIGKVVNIASRCAGFINKHFSNRLSDNLHAPEIYTALLDEKQTIIDAYFARDYARAVRHIMEWAARVNQYIDHEKPWILIKDSQRVVEVQAICTTGLNLFRIIMTGLQPILPNMSIKVTEFLRCPVLNWETIKMPLLSHTINKFEPLMQRIEQAQVDSLLSDV